MHTTKHVLGGKRFHCQKANAMVEVTITEVLFQGDGGALPEGIAYLPKCSGWQQCAAFPGAFPERLDAVSDGAASGCPIFDGNI